MWDMAIFMIILALWDAKKKEIPLALLILWGIYTLCREVFLGLALSTESGTILIKCILGALPGLFVIVMAWATQRVGYGDGIVLLLFGMREGYRSCLVLGCVSLFLMSIFSIIGLILRKVEKNTKIPYLPFVCVTYLLNSMLWKSGFL